MQTVEHLERLGDLELICRSNRSFFGKLLAQLLILQDRNEHSSEVSGITWLGQEIVRPYSVGKEKRFLLATQSCRNNGCSRCERLAHDLRPPALGDDRRQDDDIPSVHC